MSRASPLPRRSLGFSFAIGSALAFSTTAVFVRYLTDQHQLSVVVLSFWRAAFLVVVLFPALCIAQPARLVLPRRDLGMIAAQGLILAVFNLLWTTSVARCGAALATVLVYTSGPFTALLGRWLLREHLGRSGLAAIACCGVGCVVTSGVANQALLRSDIFGVALGLASGALYAIYTIIGRVGASRGIDAWVLVLHVFFVNALTQLAFLCVSTALDPLAPGLDAIFWLGSRANGWAALVGLAVGPTLFGFGLYSKSLTYLRGTEANLVLTLEPPVTIAAAYAFLGEVLTLSEFLGSGLILFGVLLLRLDRVRLPTFTSKTSLSSPRVDCRRILCRRSTTISRHIPSGN